MFTPVLELEGTWEEIAPQLPDFNGQRLRISVEVEDSSKPEMLEEKDERIAKFEAILARIKQRDEAKPDPVDWLKEGRSGGMFPDASGE